jgi:integrase
MTHPLLRAATAWKNAKLEGITLHQARHTYASLMIAAGVNDKSLQTYLGHSSVTVTYDRYGHLMPGNEEEAAAGLLDAYLERADTGVRLASVNGV